MTQPTLFDQLQIEQPINKFHNTTDLKDDQLKQRQIRNGSQNRKILNFFQSHSYENFIPFEVWKYLGINNQPKSSIQRAMTDLTTMDYLEKLDGKERPDGSKKPLVQRPGEWRELCYAWQIR